jgi:hypothetical protein
MKQNLSFHKAKSWGRTRTDHFGILKSFFCTVYIKWFLSLGQNVRQLSRLKKPTYTYPSLRFSMRLKESIIWYLALAMDIASDSWTRRPGFESHQGMGIVGNHSNAVVYNRLNMHCLCVPDYADFWDNWFYSLELSSMPTETGAHGLRDHERSWEVVRYIQSLEHLKTPCLITVSFPVTWNQY